MKAELQIKSGTADIPLFIQILSWLQKCPVKELEIYVQSFYLQKAEK